MKAEESETYAYIREVKRIEEEMKKAAEVGISAEDQKLTGACDW